MNYAVCLNPQLPYIKQLYEIIDKVGHYEEPNMEDEDLDGYIEKDANIFGMIGQSQYVPTIPNLFIQTATDKHHGNRTKDRN